MTVKMMKGPANNVDVILDAEAKGQVKWTAKVALDLGVITLM